VTIVSEISGQSLAGKYEDFHDPVVKIYAAGKEITLSEGMYLESVRVDSSMGKNPDMAVLVYHVWKQPEDNISAMEGYLDVGQKMEVKAGYGNEVTRIFLGYLHEADVCDSVPEYVEYTLICLDVKGLMKKNSVFLVSGKKKLQEILNDILNTGAYGKLIEKKSVASLPSDLNQDCVIKGETHYDWLCRLAEELNYVFYCGRGELVFGSAPEGDTLELTEEYGLKSVTSMVSMTGLTGNIQVNGYNRSDEEITASVSWKGTNADFGKNLKKLLQEYTLSYWNMELETVEQAKLTAQSLLDRATGQCRRMEAVSIGIPELVPGVRVKLTHDKVTSLSGEMSAEEVEHILDGKGYRTTVKGRCS